MRIITNWNRSSTEIIKSNLIFWLDPSITSIRTTTTTRDLSDGTLLNL